jgi:hypothetical protein
MKTLSAALAIAATIGVAQAMAATYDFQFVGGGVDLAGALTTSSTGNPELVTSLTATLNGIMVAIAPVNTIVFNPSNDNLLYPSMTGVGYYSGSAGLLDGGGLGFYSDGQLYNLYYDTAVDESYELDNFTTSNVTLVGNAPFTISAPEPTTWALMLVGVGMLGASLRAQPGRRLENKAGAIATA